MATNLPATIGISASLVPGNVTPEKPLTVKQAAVELACGPDTVRSLCSAGLLRHFRIGVGKKAYYRIPVTAVEEYKRCSGGSFGTGGDGQPMSESTDDRDEPAWRPRLVRLQNDD